MNYGMPYYHLSGQLCAFVAQKGHMSLYILNTPVLDRHRDLLKPLNVGKGCIRFKKLADLSLEAIGLILREAAADNRKFQRPLLA